MSGTAAYTTVFGLLIAAAFGLPMPEEIPVVLAGAAAGHAAAQDPPGHPIGWAIWLVCVAGVVIGDTILYAIGRLGGRPLLHAPWVERCFIPPKRRAHAEAGFRKHGIWLLLAARLTPGVRTPVFVMAGALKMPVGRFLLADGLYALPGVTLLFLLAFFWTDDCVRFVQSVEAHSAGWKWLIAAGVAAAAVALLGWRRRSSARTRSNVLIPEVERDPAVGQSADAGDRHG